MLTCDVVVDGVVESLVLDQVLVDGGLQIGRGSDGRGALWREFKIVISVHFVHYRCDDKHSPQNWTVFCPADPLK